MTTGEILKTLFLGFPVSGELVDPAWPEVFQRVGGLGLALLLTLTSLIAAAPLGGILAVAREGRNRLLRLTAGAFVEVARGLPILLLVLLVFHLSFPLFRVRVPGVVLAGFAFTVYAASYLTEILRSGFRAVDPGLLDAARVLGLSPVATLLRVRLPVAVRTMTPALLGLAITVFKDTSVLVVVAVPELTYTARRLVTGQPHDHLLVLVFLLVAYGGCAAAASALVRRLERRLAEGNPA